jgi:hypothetical protein
MTDPAGASLRAAQQAGAECLKAALYYLKQGWSALAVCPPDHAGVGKSHGQHCDSPGKAPWGPWKEFQTRLPTETELRQKWRDNPQLNVGIALGPVSGLIRIDVDGEQGEAFLQEVSKGDLPPTLEMTSGGNGRGLLYGIPAGVLVLPTHAHGDQIHEGLSLLGQGSQTVLPPSRHVSGRRYEWKPGRGPQEIELALAPQWLLDLMSREKRHALNGKAHVLAEGEIIMEGRRDDTLTSIAGTLRSRGMTADEMFVALLEVNKRCDPPLEETIVRKIADSVGNYPAGEAMQTILRFGPCNGHAPKEEKPSEPEPWDDPLPLDDCPVLPPFPVCELPAEWGAFVAQLARGTQTPSDEAALLSLAAFGGGLAGKYRICVRDGWYEPANLFAVAALPVGERKSAVFAEVMAPIQALQSELIAEKAPRLPPSKLSTRCSISGSKA